MTRSVEEAVQPLAPAQGANKPRAARASRPAAKPTAKPAAKTAVKPAAKSARTAAAKPAAKVVPPEAPAKPVKVKLVRDSFTMPSDEYALLGQLKQRALAGAHHAKKSELLRAGIMLLAGLNNAALLRALAAVPAVKTGRPKAKKGE